MSKSKNLIIIGLICLIILFCSISSINATTINVPLDYPTIQQGINNAANYDTVLVAPGIYTESINFNGKLIVVKSSIGPKVTKITNSGFNLVVFTNNETSEAVLDGFTLEGGLIGVLCENAGPTIKNNILVDQHITNWGAISLGGDGYATQGYSPAIIVNNTILNCANGGISTFSLTPPVIKNNIIAFNYHYGIHREGSAAVAQPLLSYNCVFGNSVAYQEIPSGGTGTIELDPLLFGDYSLYAVSPCIDAGDPNPVYNDPDGTRNDMGAIPFVYVAPRDPMTLRVPSEYPTINSAMNVAVMYDTILVADGTYQESVFLSHGSILLISENGPEVTTIISNSTSSNYKLPANIDTVATEIYLTSEDSAQYTGQTGLYYQSLAYANATMPVITVPPGSGTQTIISGFTIDGNNVSRGVVGENCSPTLENCIIKNCSGPYDGGGVWFENGAPKIIGNTFYNNKTPISGGAVFIRLGVGYGTPEITGNVFYDNFSGNGPAISLIEGDSALVNYNVAYNNAAYPGSQRRGAIYIRGVDLRVINNTSDHNTVGFSALDTKDCLVTNNILSNNLEGGFEVVTDYGMNVNLTYDYNNLWQNQPNDYIYSSPAAHDLNVTPIYCDATDGNYSLSSNSTCLPANNIYGVLYGAKDVGCNYICGDINGDETVDLNDIMALISYYFECGEEPVIFNNADLNCNDYIDLSDLLTLARLINDGIADPCCY